MCAADVNSSEVTTAYPHQSPRRGTRRQRPPAVPLLLEMTVSSNPDRVSDPLSEAIACATRNHGTAERAVETTKRVLNLHLERAVLASIDYAPTVEEQSFQTEDFPKIVTRRNASHVESALRRKLLRALDGAGDAAGVLPRQQHGGLRHRLWRFDHLGQNLEATATGEPALGEHHPYRWAMVTATSGLDPVNRNFRCELEVDGSWSPPTQGHRRCAPSVIGDGLRLKLSQPPAGLRPPVGADTPRRTPAFQRAPQTYRPPAPSP